MSHKNPLISVVVPAYNEEGGLAAFYDALSPQLDSTGDDWELLFINDGSRDRTLEILMSLRDRDPRVKIIDFARNFGHQIAITAGMEHAGGDAVIVMDADLQHPPTLVPEMVRMWKEGNHVVYTVRTYGEEIGPFKKFTSNAFYKVLNLVSDIELKPGVSDFRLLDRVVLDYINAMPEKARFIRGMVSWLGFRQIGVPYKAAPRFAGSSKFSTIKMLRFAAEGITSFSTRPLRWIMYLGFFTAISVIPYALWAIYQFFFLDVAVPGWSSLIVAILFLGGVQLISLGVIGEYIGRIYNEVKRRPLYSVQRKVGFEQAGGRRQEAGEKYPRAA